MPKCSKCKKDLTEDLFQVGNKTYKTCNSCREKIRKQVQEVKQKTLKEIKEGEQYCRLCKNKYNINNFDMGKKGRLKTCKFCKNKKDKKIEEKTKDIKENQKYCKGCKQILDTEKFKTRLNGERQSKCIECNKKMLDYLKNNRCPHGLMNKSACKECGGASICIHGRTRTYCNECDGGSMCEHNKRKDRCGDCAELYGRHQYCEHNRLKTSCHDCGGGSICEHGTRRTRCKECEGGSICEHKIMRDDCRYCDFSGFLSGRVSSQVRKALKESKSKKSIEYLGTDSVTYRKYLESRFVEGMTWENYGTEWEIDHIIPIKYENPTIEEVVKRLHYKNTQPLWASLNASKNNRYIFELVATADCSDNVVDDVKSEENSVIC